MELAALILIQLLATAVGFGLLWRKLDAVGADVARIKRMLETLELMRFSSAAQKREAQAQRTDSVLTAVAKEPPPSALGVNGTPVSADWTRPAVRPPRENNEAPVGRPLSQRTPAPRQVMANELADDSSWRANVTPETGRLIASVAMMAAPALAFPFGAPAAALVACGLSLCAALMVIALRPSWSAAAFVGAFGAGAWVLTAFALNAAQSAPIVFSALATLSTCVGLAHASRRGMAPGLLMTLLMGGALIALGSLVGLAGPAGVGYGAVVAVAAMVGASSVRLEGIHLGAFAASIFGLYVFSGQDAAAIWFTPVTAWAGALFLAIAVVRTPMLGERAGVVTATGVAAPILSTSALSLSEHGLANAWAAAGAFAALALIFVGLIVVAAQRDKRGVDNLQLTAWILLGGAIIAYLSAVLLALPFAFAATAAACGGLGLAARDYYGPHRLWRAGAFSMFIASALIAWAAVRPEWPDLLTFSAALAAPTLLAAGAARISDIRASKGAAAIFEAVALIGGAATLVALVRFALSGGAPNDVRIGFVEAGVHLTVWASAALALALRSHHGAQAVRRIASAAFGILALSGCSVAGALWLTRFWVVRAPSGIDAALMQHYPLGFALPAIIAWVHWAYWRASGVQIRTRVALASAALLTAAFIALEAFGVREGAVAMGQPDWVMIGAVVVSFGLAIAINFAPGVTDETGARLRFDKYFQRNRRREQRI